MLDASLIWKPKSRSGGLYMGGFPHDPQSVSASGFELLVLCAAEKLASLGEPSEVDTSQAYGCTTLHAPFYDDVVTPETDRYATHAAAVVAKAAKRGNKVLVTCNEGRNRSGLVTALALLRLQPELPAAQVIDLIKTRRNAPSGREALTNDDFRELIESRAR